MHDVHTNGHVPMWKTPEKYVEAKLKILRRDFRITPTENEIIHLKSLKTQIAIDNACLGIINRHWD